MSAAMIQRSMMRAAFSAANIFAWVTIFSYLLAHKGSLALGLSAVALLYALQHVIIVLLTPLVARHLAHGMRNQMTLGVLAASAAFAVLGVGSIAGNDAFTLAICAYVVLLGIYRALYFTPYALLSDVSRRSMHIEVFILLLPAVAGALIFLEVLTPSLLFFAASIVLACSVLPIFWIHDRLEGFSWGYRESFHQLFDSRHRALVLSAFCDGVEAVALLLVWPIVIWLMLSGSPVLLGLIISVTLLLALLVRRIFYYFSYTPSPTHEVIIRISAWILRSVTGSPGSIVLVDAYSSSASPRSRGMDHATLEQAADNHTYVDEYTALKEMSNGIGRVVACLVIGIFSPLLAFGVSTTGIFVVAAMVSGLSVIAARQHVRAAF